MVNSISLFSIPTQPESEPITENDGYVSNEGELITTTLQCRNIKPLSSKSCIAISQEIATGFKLIQGFASLTNLDKALTIADNALKYNLPPNVMKSAYILKMKALNKKNINYCDKQENMDTYYDLLSIYTIEELPVEFLQYLGKMLYQCKEFNNARLVLESAYNRLNPSLQITNAQYPQMKNIIITLAKIYQLSKKSVDLAKCIEMLENFIAKSYLIDDIKHKTSYNIFLTLAIIYCSTNNYKYWHKASNIISETLVANQKNNQVIKQLKFQLANCYANFNDIFYLRKSLTILLKLRSMESGDVCKASTNIIFEKSIIYVFLKIKNYGILSTDDLHIAISAIKALLNNKLNEDLYLECKLNLFKLFMYRSVNNDMLNAESFIENLHKKYLDFQKKQSRQYVDVLICLCELYIQKDQNELIIYGIKLVDDFLLKVENEALLQQYIYSQILLYECKIKMYNILKKEYDIDNELQKLLKLSTKLDDTEIHYVRNYTKLQLIMVAVLLSNYDRKNVNQLQQSRFEQALNIIYSLRELHQENRYITCDSIEVENTFIHLCIKNPHDKRIKQEIQDVIYHLRKTFNSQRNPLEVSECLVTESLFCQYLCATDEQQDLQLAIDNYEFLLLKIGKKNEFICGNEHLDKSYCLALSLRHDMMSVHKAQQLLACLINHYPNFNSKKSFMVISQQIIDTQKILEVQEVDSHLCTKGILYLFNEDFKNFGILISSYKDNCDFNYLMTYYNLCYFLSVNIDLGSNDQTAKKHDELKFIVNLLNAIEYGCKDSTLPKSWVLLQHCLVLYYLIPETIMLPALQKKYPQTYQIKMQEILALFKNIFPKAISILDIFEFESKLSIKPFAKRFDLMRNKLRLRFADSVQKTATLN